MLQNIKKDLAVFADPKRAEANMWFFQTKKGQYGAHEKFIGVKVPDQRKIARKYRTTSLSDLERLLQSKIHEHRLTALFILTYQFERGDPSTQKKIVDLYVKNIQHVNNWDLVDSSAGYILGSYLVNRRDRKILYTFARSHHLWKKRIAIIATLPFLYRRDHHDTLALAKILLHDPHDLIHKAVGWMLREMGKRNIAAEEIFLAKYAHAMPRTMLRYAIEKFSKRTKERYMKL